VLGYEQKLWPHSPGLLRRIVRKNFEWQWSLGCFDEGRGKLIETLTPQGSPDVRERYIDNGHPYWCMQSYAFLSLPDDDPFWTDEEEPLPVEKETFLTRFEGPRMLLIGTKRSGHVRWVHANTVPRRDYYRDKYSKFAYSSCFAFNSLNEAGRVPWDQALVLRDKKSGSVTGRKSVIEGRLLDEGVETRWTAELLDVGFEIRTVIHLDDEFEHHQHEIRCLGELPAGLEILEGSYALGLEEDEAVEEHRLENGLLLSRRNGMAVAVWLGEGYEQVRAVGDFDQVDPSPVNLLCPRMQVITCSVDITQPVLRVASMYYASPKPLPVRELGRRAAELLARWGSS
jgi:hypothetical protein